MKNITIEISELNLIKALAQSMQDVCVVHHDKVILDLDKFYNQDFYFKALGKLYKIKGYRINTANNDEVPEIVLQKVY